MEILVVGSESFPSDSILPPWFTDRELSTRVEITQSTNGEERFVLMLDEISTILRPNLQGKPEIKSSVQDASFMSSRTGHHYRSLGVFKVSARVAYFVADFHPFFITGLCHSIVVNEAIFQVLEQAFHPLRLLVPLHLLHFGMTPEHDPSAGAKDIRSSLTMRSSLPRFAFAAQECRLPLVQIASRNKSFHWPCCSDRSMELPPSNFQHLHGHCSYLLYEHHPSAGLHRPSSLESQDHAHQVEWRYLEIR